MKRGPTWRQRLVYVIDLILSKGLWGVLLVAVAGTLLLLFVLTPILLALQIFIFGRGSWSQLPYMIWAGFAQVFKLGSAEGSWLDQIGAVLVALIGIFFTGVVFGILVRSISDKMRKLRDTGSQIVAEHHTAILGWSGIGTTVVEQLAIANENRRKPVVAVIDRRSKLSNEESIKDVDLRNTRVLFRKGRPNKPGDLDVIRVDLADRVIAMADFGADDYDEQIITELLALSRYKEKNPEWNATVVALIKNGYNHPSATVAAEFPAVILDVRQFLSRLMLRTTMQPGLYSVYTDLFNFGGDEMYIVHEPSLVGKTMGDALLAYPDSSPVGIQTPGKAILHPDLHTVIGPEDRLVLLTADDDTAIVGPVPEVDESAIVATGPAVGPSGPEGASKWLFVGWSPTLGDILYELASYSTGQVSVEIVCRDDDLVRIADIHTDYPGVEVTVSPWPDHIDPSVMLRQKDFPALDYVVVFNQRTDPETRDSSTLMVMLQATAIAQSLPEGRRPVIVTELIETSLRKLCKPGLADIVVNSEMVALLTAQLSENPDLLPIMVDLVDAEGSELYLKDAGLYVRPGPVNYATLVEAARRRGEIAIGYRRRADALNRKANFGAMLNPAKKTVLEVEPGDQLIVVAQDRF